MDKNSAETLPLWITSLQVHSYILKILLNFRKFGSLNDCFETNQFDFCGCYFHCTFEGFLNYTCSHIRAGGELEEDMCISAISLFETYIGEEDRVDSIAEIIPTMLSSTLVAMQYKSSSQEAEAYGDCSKDEAKPTIRYCAHSAISKLSNQHSKINFLLQCRFSELRQQNVDWFVIEPALYCLSFVFVDLFKIKSFFFDSIAYAMLMCKSAAIEPLLVCTCMRLLARRCFRLANYSDCSDALNVIIQNAHHDDHRVSFNAICSLRLIVESIWRQPMILEDVINSLSGISRCSITRGSCRNAREIVQILSKLCSDEAIINQYKTRIVNILKEIFQRMNVHHTAVGKFFDCLSFIVRYQDPFLFECIFPYVGECLHIIEKIVVDDDNNFINSDHTIKHCMNFLAVCLEYCNTDIIVTEPWLRVMNAVVLKSLSEGPKLMRRYSYRILGGMCERNLLNSDMINCNKEDFLFNSVIPCLISDISEQLVLSHASHFSSMTLGIVFYHEVCRSQSLINKFEDLFLAKTLSVCIKKLDVPDMNSAKNLLQYLSIVLLICKFISIYSVKVFATLNTSSCCKLVAESLLTGVLNQGEEVDCIIALNVILEQIVADAVRLNSEVHQTLVEIFENESELKTDVALYKRTEMIVKTCMIENKR
ncbi:hypothetical protein AKO1_007768 [Acrasis kona]|uniref:Uncharacterized protein n=1 Tax=Acrasis kona TaxID=1008807 RepID=A0AAW2YQW0_9EUKA